MINDSPFVRFANAARIILPLLAITAVALRFVARFEKGNKIKRDDWTVVASLVRYKGSSNSPCTKFYKIPSIVLCMNGLYAGSIGLLGADLRTMPDYVLYKKV